MYCICCKIDKVKPDDYLTTSQSSHKSEEELLWRNEKHKDGYLTIDNGMVNNGIIQIIEAGYGSKHDGDRLILAICDDCISKNLEDATLLYFSNYMSWPGVKDEVDNSKIKYRRRKNLDGLV